MQVRMPGLAAMMLAGALTAPGAAVVAQERPPERPPLPAMPSTGGIGTVTTRPAALTEDQKAAIARAVTQADRKVKVPPGVDARVGAELPASMELHMLPDQALADIPEAKSYRYTVVENNVVLVDPTNMRVVEVVAK